MKISCITTVFNEGALLRKSVNSVLAQSYGNFEYLIVDDGSAPETLEILSEFTDERIQIIRQANDGLSSARNKALGMVTGDYVCFLDADDTRPVWAFEAIARKIKASDPDVVLCRGALSETNDRLHPFYDDAVLAALGAAIAELGPDFSETDYRRVQALAQLAEPQSANKVIRADLIRDRLLRFPNTHFFEDIYFHTLAIASARRIASCDAICYTYYRRYSKPQITSARDALRFDVMAVARLTLDRFAALPQMGDEAYRQAVLLSCLKLVQWCEAVVSHHHKHHFRELVTALLCLIDPAYLDGPVSIPLAHDISAPQRTYLKELLRDPRLPYSPPHSQPDSLSDSPLPGDEAPDAGPERRSILQRLWPTRHA